MREDKIKVLIKEPGEEVHEALIRNELSEFQNLVDGYIEIISPLKNKNIVSVINDFGKVIGLQHNFIFTDKDIICGTAIFTKTNSDGDFVSLKKRDVLQIEKYLKTRSIYYV